MTFTRSGTQTYFDSTGTLQTATTNVAAFDYDPTTLVPLGLSMWEARTNLVLNSLADGTALSTQSVTVAAVAHTLSFYGTGTVTLTGTSTAGPLVGTGATTRVSLTFTPTAGSLTLTVSGTVKWCNLEAGAFATPYIATTAAAATRAAPVCSTTDLSWFNATEGTFVSKQTRYATAIADGNIYEINDGTSANRISGGTGASGSVLNPFVIVSNVAQATLTQGAGSVVNTHTMAVAIKANDFAASTDGAAVVTDVSGTMPTVTTLTVGKNSGAAAYWNGWIASLTYYPLRLPNATLQFLTA